MRKEEPELIGKIFGRLEVISFDYQKTKDKDVPYYWCRCSCGNVKSIEKYSLTRNLTKSCGCLNREIHSENKTHGDSKSKLYDLWVNMKQRCLNPDNPSYKNYGGRGIGIYKPWIDSYETFKEFAINNDYIESITTIDRTDNDKGYFPDNVRFVSNTINQNNRRTNHSITFNGETHNLGEWAELLGINKSTLSTRIDSLKWSIEDALTIPVRTRVRKV